MPMKYLRSYTLMWHTWSIHSLLATIIRMNSIDIVGGMLILFILGGGFGYYAARIVFSI